MNKKPLAHYIWLILFVPIAYLGCTDRGTPVAVTPAKATVAFNGQTPLVVPILWAADQKHPDIAIAVQPHGTGRDAIASLLAGHADFAISSETPLLHAVMQKQGLRIIGTYARSRLHLKCIARRDHGIKLPSDLKGKSFGTARGTNFEFYMHEFLKKNHVPFAEEDFLNLNSPDMVAALVAGRVDAVFTHEPFISRIRKALPDESVIVFQPDDVYDLTYNVVVSSDRSKCPSIETQRAFLRAILTSIKAMEDRPDDAIAVGSKESGIDPVVMKAIWPEYRWKLTLDDSLLALLKRESDWIAARSPDKATSLSHEQVLVLVDREPLQQCDPSAVEISSP